jgi:hypothetical protein
MVVLSQEIKLPELESNNIFPSATEIKSAKNYSSIPSAVLMV